MSQRHSALVAEAKQHDVSPPAWKDETARRVREYRTRQRQAEESARQIKDLFADQSSQQARIMRAEIERVARRSFNILITGETGTGRLMRHEKSTDDQRGPIIRSWSSTAPICRNS